MALYFTTLNQLRYLAYVGYKRGIPLADKLVDGNSNRGSKTANLLMGAMARTLAGTILMPVTILKVRFESTFYQYPSILSAISTIYQENGIRGLFRGWGATVLRDAPHAGLYLMFYELIKPFLSSDALGKLLSGMTAGFMATTATQPFDLIKTRIQLAKNRTGFTQNFIDVVQREGLIGLFNGMGPRLVRKSLSSAITWTVYEEIIAFFKQPKP